MIKRKNQCLRTCSAYGEQVLFVVSYLFVSYLFVSYLLVSYLLVSYLILNK